MKVACFILLSMVLGGAFAGADLGIRRLFQFRSEEAVASQICQEFTLRGQTGGTRDMQEQAAAVFKIYATSRRSSVVLDDSGTPLGGFAPTDLDSFSTYPCLVEGRSDVHLKFYIEKPNFSFLEWVKRFVAYFFLFTFLTLFFRTLIAEVQKRTAAAFTAELADTFGLEISYERSNLWSLFFQRFGFFSNPAVTKLKLQLQNMKTEIEFRQGQATNLQVQLSTKENIERQAEALSRLILQVRHDIVSPLSALRVQLTMLEKSSNEARDLESVISRIEEIIGDLETQEQLNLTSHKTPVLEVAEVLLQQIVNDKNRVRGARDECFIEFHYNKSDLTPVMIEPGHFRRAISNIIQNSIDAFQGRPGKITVSATSSSQMICITIADNGSGIGPDILHKIGDYGATFGKNGRGLGLGLFHAKTSLARWGGSFSIESQLDHGTTVSLTLPRAPGAPRFTADLSRFGIKKAVVVDDDINQLTRIRDGISGFDGQVFTNLRDVLAWYQNAEFPDEYIYLVDFHLKQQGATGVHLVESLPLGFEIMMWTSDYTNPAILASALRIGFPIVPKPLVV